MTIKNVYYTNHSCKYYSRHEWTIETTSKDEKEVLDYCRQYMAKKSRSREEYLYAKEKADRKKMEAMMVIDGDAEHIADVSKKISSSELPNNCKKGGEQ